MDSPRAAATPSTASPQVTFHELLTSFHQFLIILTHSILYYRRVYPEDSFKLARFYDIAVHQNRHPGVCDWIQEVTSSCLENIQKVIFVYYLTYLYPPSGFIYFMFFFSLPSLIANLFS